MITFFIVGIILLVGSNTYLYHEWSKMNQRAEFWFVTWDRASDALAKLELQLSTAETDYADLMRGRDEESEAYEQMYLSNQDTIEAMSLTLDYKNDQLRTMSEIVRIHEQGCLPDLACIRKNNEDLAARLQDLRSKLTGE